MLRNSLVVVQLVLLGATVSAQEVEVHRVMTIAVDDEEQTWVLAGSRNAPTAHETLVQFPGCRGVGVGRAYLVGERASADRQFTLVSSDVRDARAVERAALGLRTPSVGTEWWDAYRLQNAAPSRQTDSIAIAGSWSGTLPSLQARHSSMSPDFATACNNQRQLTSERTGLLHCFEGLNIVESWRNEVFGDDLINSYRLNVRSGEADGTIEGHFVRLLRNHDGWVAVVSRLEGLRLVPLAS